MTTPWVKVAAATDVSPGGLKAVETGGKRLVLCNAGGTFYAVDDRCTHDDGPLADGTLDDRLIECPRHGARFDLATGAVECLPAAVPIRSYPVKVEGRDVFVNVSER